MGSASNQQCPLFLPLWIWQACVSWGIQRQHRCPTVGRKPGCRAYSINIYFLTSYRPFFPVHVFFRLRNSVFLAILRNLKGEIWRSSRHVGNKDLSMNRMPRLKTTEKKRDTFDFFLLFYLRKLAHLKLLDTGKDLISNERNSMFLKQGDFQSEARCAFSSFYLAAIMKGKKIYQFSRGYITGLPQSVRKC